MRKPARPLRLIELLTVIALVGVGIAALLPRCQQPKIPHTAESGR